MTSLVDLVRIMRLMVPKSVFGGSKKKARNKLVNILLFLSKKYNDGVQQLTFAMVLFS